jgi:hypothetical protein
MVHLAQSVDGQRFGWVPELDLTRANRLTFLAELS